MTLAMVALLSSLFLYNDRVPVRLGNGFKHWHAHVTPEATQLGFQAARTFLVGGLNPSEKYEFVNWDDEILNIWKNTSHVPATTN